tara:strand:- start:102 stop:239 length:138 start_codon:yes stop_codon:yes gene_type:complete
VDVVGHVHSVVRYDCAHATLAPSEHVVVPSVVVVAVLVVAVDQPT